MNFDFDEKKVLEQIQRDLWDFDAEADVRSHAKQPDFNDSQGAAAGFSKESSDRALADTGQLLQAADTVYEVKIALKTFVANTNAQLFRSKKEAEFLTHKIKELRDRIQRLEGMSGMNTGAKI